MIDFPPKPAGEMATDAQWKAIHYPSGQSNILLSASAGSGKTRVLVDRVLSLLLSKQPQVDTGLASHEVDIDRLLVITFTQAAAREMKDKIEIKIKQAINDSHDHLKKHHLIRQLPKLPQAQISTIHSFCLDVIQRFYYLIDLDPVFRQLTDPPEMTMIKEDIWADLTEEFYSGPDQQAFTDLVTVFSTVGDDSKLTDWVENIYQLAVAQPNPSQWIDQMDHLYQDLDADQFYQSDLWVNLLWPSLQGKIKKNIADLAAGQKACLGHEDLEAVSLLLEKDIQFNQDLLTLLENQDFNQARSLMMSFDFESYPRKKIKDEEVKALKERVKRVRDQAKGAINNDVFKKYFLFDLETHLALAKDMKGHIQGLKRLTHAFGKAYEDYKRDRKLVDFNDLEHFAYQILRAENEEGVQEAAAYYQDRFVEILIDEYQDTNPLQEEIIKLISRQDVQANRFMVGDVKQSIYRFRMAEPSLFMEKYKSYEDNEKAGSNQRMILQENFRSRPEVLSFTNFVFQHVMDEDLGEIAYDQDAYLKHGFKDFPSSSIMQAELLVVESESEPEEAPTPMDDNAHYNYFSNSTKAEITLIACKIKALLDQGFLIYDKAVGQERPLQYKDIVILSRTKKDNAHFQSIFNLMDIPLVVNATQNYFQAIEVSIMMSLLNIIDNPHQDIPLAAVLRSSMVGLDEDQLAAIRIASPSGNYYRAMQAYMDQTEDKDALARQLMEFNKQLDHWRQLARRIPIAELIWQIYHETGFLDYVGGLAGGDQRRANLHALYERAIEYEKSQYKGLYRFNRYIEKMREREDDLNEPMVLSADDDHVHLMTIHNSKGLEFPVVFIQGFSSRINASDFTRDVIIDKDHGLALNYIDPPQRIKSTSLQQAALAQQVKIKSYSEEMRVLYVALTRAEQKLYIIGHAKDAEDLLSHWTTNQRQSEGPIDVMSRLQATCIMDWIGLALGPSIDLETSTYPHYQSVDQEEAPFSIHFYTKFKLYQFIQRQHVRPSTGSWLDSLKKGKKESLSDLSQAAVQLMEATYDFPMSTQTTSYQSVSEIKRVFEDPDQKNLLALDEKNPLGQNRYVVDDIERPKFISEELVPTPAEVGMATHLLLQELDFSSLPQQDDIDRQAKALVDKGQISQTLADRIEVDQVLAFMQTDLASRMVQAHQTLEKELSFSLKIPAADIFASFDGEDDILVHGIVDGFFEEEGELVLFDYKTDQTRWKGQHAVDYLLGKYKGQLNLYKIALENSLAKKVKEAYIIGLDQTLIIPL